LVAFLFPLQNKDKNFAQVKETLLSFQPQNFFFCFALLQKKDKINFQKKFFCKTFLFSSSGSSLASKLLFIPNSE
jgi:hypothetical protein